MRSIIYWLLLHSSCHQLWFTAAGRYCKFDPLNRWDLSNNSFSQSLLSTQFYISKLPSIEIFLKLTPTKLKYAFIWSLNYSWTKPKRSDISSCPCLYGVLLLLSRPELRCERTPLGGCPSSCADGHLRYTSKTTNHLCLPMFLTFLSQ